MQSSRATSRTVGIFCLTLWFVCLLWRSAPAAAYDGSTLIFSPWKKFCLHKPTNVDEKTCFTSLDAQYPSGMPLAALTVISADSPPPKPVLRITLSLSTDSNVPFYPDLTQGLTITFDQGQPRRVQYTTCYPGGCLAEMDIDPTLIKTLREAHQVQLRAPRLMGKEALEITIPVEGFGPAYNAPYDFKAAEEASRKEQEARKEWLASNGAPARKRIPGSSSPPCSYPTTQQ